MSNWCEPDEDMTEGWAAWCAERPSAVRKVAKRFPPWSLWRLDNGKGRRVYPRSFEEMPDGSVTMTVVVSAQFNQVLAERMVFGVKPEDLVPAGLPGPDEPVGSMGVSISVAKGNLDPDGN